MAVGFLHEGAVFIVQLVVEDHAAVATLVSNGHIVQNHPKVVICKSKVQLCCLLAVVSMGMTIDPSCTVLVTVGSEKPAVSQDISWVQGGTSLVTQ